MSLENSSTTRKLLVSAIAIGATAAIAGMATFGSFTSTTSASTPVSSGTVAIALGAAGQATNRLAVAATGIVPGDTIERTVDVLNTGSEGFGSVSLDAKATSTSLLDQDSVDGLHLVIDKCSVAWTESGAAPAFTYACGGVTSQVLASQAVASPIGVLSGISLNAGDANHLRFKLGLPQSAPNAMQGLTTALEYSFTGMQRSGAAR
jgi:predicted ribosomally synthesized peptide with SipW-like signal peptide